MKLVYEIMGALILWQCMVSQAVMKCPGSKEDWRKASITLQCREPNYYHCLRDEKGQITQQCLQIILVEVDKCPEFNTNVERLDVYQCKSTQNNCPTTNYYSNEVFKYPGCFQNVSSIAPKSTTSFTLLVTTVNAITTKDSESTNDKSTTKNPSNDISIIPIIIPFIIIGVLLVLFLGVGYMFLRRRNRSGGGQTDNQSPEEDEILQVSELTDINTRGGQTDNQSPEEENMLQELRPSHNDTERGNNANSNSCIKEGYSQNPGQKLENDSTKLDEQLRELVEKIKEKKMEKKRIVFIPSHATVDEDKIAEAAKGMGENVVVENDFYKWMTNKSKRMYVFKDWVLSDQEKCIKELKKTFIDVLQSVIKNETKFVIIFPLSIWNKDAKLMEILRGCPVCKISY